VSRELEKAQKAVPDGARSDAPHASRVEIDTDGDGFPDAVVDAAASSGR
jgi:hypothetical protein